MNVDIRIKRGHGRPRHGAGAGEPGREALRAAARRRGYRLIYGSGASVVVLGLAAAGATQLWFAAPAPPGARPATAPCVQYTSGSNGLPDVPRADWPDFVAAAVAALPDRFDYSMQSGYGWCDFAPRTESALAYYPGPSVAYAVINIGRNRESGHLAIDVHIRGHAPRDCTEAAQSLRPFQSLLFCDEPTADTPLTVGQGSDGLVVVTSYYADGTVIEMESYAPAITAEHLRAAVTDPYLHATVPLAAGAPDDVPGVEPPLPVPVTTQ